MADDRGREHEQRHLAALHNAMEADRNPEAGAIFGAAKPASAVSPAMAGAGTEPGKTLVLGGVEQIDDLQRQQFLAAVAE